MSCQFRCRRSLSTLPNLDHRIDRRAVRLDVAGGHLGPRLHRQRPWRYRAAKRNRPDEPSHGELNLERIYRRSDDRLGGHPVNLGELDRWMLGDPCDRASRAGRYVFW